MALVSYDLLWPALSGPLRTATARRHFRSVGLLRYGSCNSDQHKFSGRPLNWPLTHIYRKYLTNLLHQYQQMVEYRPVQLDSASSQVSKLGVSTVSRTCIQMWLHCNFGYNCEREYSSIVLVCTTNLRSPFETVVLGLIPVN